MAGRIAVGGIHIECSTYSPLRTELADFRVLRGPEIAASDDFAFLREYCADFLPTLHARAIPGGPLSRSTYDALKGEFLERLRAVRPVAGLYLAMHGAMAVDGIDDAEGDWITAARDVVGADCLVAASYDLHGNLSPLIIDQLDLFSTYRTAPHVDVEATMRRAVAMLVRGLGETCRPGPSGACRPGPSGACRPGPSGACRPGIVWAPVPVVLPGERTSTVDEPARTLYGMLPAIDMQDGIWDASLLVGYVWADEPRATAAAVLTGTDRDQLEREAARLAQAYWDAREAFSFGPETGDLDTIIARALASPTHPVVIADSGDNPTAGGVGDRVDVLRALIRAGVREAMVAGIADPAATAACYSAGAGSRITLQVGAALDPAGGTPVSIEADIVHLHQTTEAAAREAVVRVDGIMLVLGARRRPYHHLSDFARLGLDPRAARMVVVKSGYLSPALALIANPNLMVLSPGVVDQAIERLPRLRMTRPTYPFDRDFTYTPTAFASARFVRAIAP